MKIKWFLSVFLAFLLILLLFIGIYSQVEHPPKRNLPDVLVGVDAVYDSVEDIERLVDEVKSYTNFLVIGSTGITWNTSKLNEVCQYIYDNGLYFTIYLHPDPSGQSYQVQWIDYARQKWGDRFIGLYTYDEPGGYQIDSEIYKLVEEANNYTDAAEKYVRNLNGNLSYFRDDWNVGKFPLFTSDYVLYEFDYRAGYDSIFAEFASNHSRPINVALCRGAATLRNKDWGAMMTWTYTEAPYLESGPELYNDMVLAYQNGARYILIFDLQKANETFRSLQEEHLDALKQFWQYMKNNPRTNDPISDRFAYVLPKDYGYGFRGANDRIWGFWEADNLTDKIWNDVTALLNQEEYKIKMDIIYEDSLQPVLPKYSKLIFWNGTIITNSSSM